MRYVVYSKGLHATWLLNCEYAALFDCGEGCATQLGYRVFVPTASSYRTATSTTFRACRLLGLRNSTKGANDKPLCIYYPAGHLRVEEWLPVQPKTSWSVEVSAERPTPAGAKRAPLPTRQDRGRALRRRHFLSRKELTRAMATARLCDSEAEV